MTSFTLAGEYITAHKHVGKTAGRSKIRDKNTLYKERAKLRRSDEATGEKGEGEILADYGTRGRYDPPKLWFPCSFFVLLFVVSGQTGGTDVDTSAGQAKRG